jgi:hypothetical protein
MIMSTPESSYDGNDATGTLTLLGKRTVDSAVEGLEESLVLKRFKGDRNNPARKYAYSDL